LRIGSKCLTLNINEGHCAQSEKTTGSERQWPTISGAAFAPSDRNAGIAVALNQTVSSGYDLGIGVSTERFLPYPQRVTVNDTPGQ
jgi:hypothetical protein